MTPTRCHAAPTPSAPLAWPAAVPAQEFSTQLVLESPDTRSRMVRQGADTAFLGNERYGHFLAAELPRWARAVKVSGAKLD